MNFYEELKTIDFDDLFDRLVAYASKRLHSVKIHEMDSKEPCDIVADLLEKVLTGVRNAETADCPLDEFLFGCLRSDIDAFFKRKKIQFETIAEDISFSGPGSETPQQTITCKEQVITQLRTAGADEEEISVFNIWTEGITKSAEVAAELGLPATAVYKIQRRLLRHLQEIRKTLNAFV